MKKFNFLRKYIENIELYTQTNNIWSHDIMTSPKYQRYMSGKEKGEKDPDYIYEYFCLGVSICNSFNLNFNKNKTPKIFNSELKKNNGYYYLQNNKCEIGKESFLDWNVVKEILNIESIDHDYTGKVDVKSDYFYIARIHYKNTGHYCLIVGGSQDKLRLHDPYTGEYRVEKPTKIIRIKFKKQG